mgnify:CR=1 FL=1
MLLQFLEKYSDQLLELQRVILYCLVYYFAAFFFVMLCPVSFHHSSSLEYETLVDIVYHHIVSQLPPKSEIIAGSPAAPFGAYLSIAMHLAGLISMPLIVYRFLRYVSDAMYPNEWRLVKKYLVPILSTFYIGLIYGWVVVAPMVIVVVFGVGRQAIPVSPVFYVQELVDLAMNSVFISALIFMVGPLLRLFIDLGVLERSDVMRNKKWFYLAVFLIIMIIDNEPFFVCEALVTIPVIAITELSLRLGYKKF